MQILCCGNNDCYSFWARTRPPGHDNLSTNLELKQCHSFFNCQILEQLPWNEIQEHVCTPLSLYKRWWNIWLIWIRLEYLYLLSPVLLLPSLFPDLHFSKAPQVSAKTVVREKYLICSKAAEESLVEWTLNLDGSQRVLFLQIPSLTSGFWCLGTENTSPLSFISPTFMTLSCSWFLLFSSLSCSAWSSITLVCTSSFSFSSMLISFWSVSSWAISCSRWFIRSKMFWRTNKFHTVVWCPTGNCNFRQCFSACPDFANLALYYLKS